MKKFFIYVAFILCCLVIKTTEASVRSAAEPPLPRSTDTKKNEADLKKLYQEIPDLNDTVALQEYLKKRLKVVQPVYMSEEELSSPSSISMVDTNNPQKSEQDTLTAYEKIYEESFKKATAENAPLNAHDKISGDFYELVPDTTNQAFVPDFPYVMVKLSDDREIMAPAEEHIAYLLTTINIAPTGLMDITEEFTFVSNNIGFPQGFFRILPKYTYSRAGSRRRLDFTLKSVTVNNTEYPYKVTEIGNYLYIEPEHPLNLPTGIYTYRFNYLIDRTVWFYENFDEFYWDITAQTLKNVVGSANAVIILPTGSSFLGQNALVSTQNTLDPKRVTITTLDKSSLGFADTEALGVGDDIHIFITLDKETLLAPDIMKKYLWFIQDYGAIIFALLTLLAIFISYKISLRQIHLNQDKTRASLKKTPAIFRKINTNIFDTRSLLAEILDLAAKNIITVTTQNETVVIVKKTDDIKKWAKPTRKLVEILFPGSETILPATEVSKLKLKRAYKYIKQQTWKEYRNYILKLNSLYLIFSGAMLLSGIIAASMIAVNPLHTFMVIFCCSLLMLLYLSLINIHFNKKWLNILVKVLSFFGLLSIAGWMGIYTSTIYSALMIITLYLILYYYHAFSKRNGLLRNKIKETEEYKSYLQKNPELAVSARDFITRAPYIYAFALEAKYKDVAILKQIATYEPLITNPK